MCLLARRGPEVLAFLGAHAGTVDALARHLDTTSIAEVLLPQPARTTPLETI